MALVNPFSKMSFSGGNYVLEGVSAEQWNAFTIEEEFSQRRLPKPSSVASSEWSDSSSDGGGGVSNPNPPMSSLVKSDNHGRAGTPVSAWSKLDRAFSSKHLDIERVLDAELISIFMKYVANHAPTGYVDRRRIDYFVKLIGIPLDYFPDNVHYYPMSPRYSGSSYGRFGNVGEKRIDSEGNCKADAYDGRMGCRGCYQAKDKRWSLLNSVIGLGPVSSPVVSNRLTRSRSSSPPSKHYEGRELKSSIRRLRHTRTEPHSESRPRLLLF